VNRKVYISDWGTYGLIEFMDVVQNIMLKIVIKNIKLLMERLVANRHKKEEIPASIPSRVLEKFSSDLFLLSAFSCPRVHSAYKGMTTKEFPWG
jgi:hypothetical protein